MSSNTSKESFLLNKENTDTLTAQKKTRPQETLGFKFNRRNKTCSFNVLFRTGRRKMNNRNKKQIYKLSTLFSNNAEERKIFFLLVTLMLLLLLTE